ncbi:protein NTM1-like 9 [Diospyros lotus]|uniref:protein NTM1-like 9 n=1 Tax=Diospyros lotus TaxID=55363 RepID=UPI00225639C5|nr:protein NTM1-like 9 [Diospyros lotus]
MMAASTLKSLAVGYRFCPTDYELINHFLRLKINGDEEAVSIIREVDIYQCEPWDLAGMSLIPTTDEVWFFFCPVGRKYQSGKRLKRATDAGYWKATGKDRTIKYVGRTSVIGTKKTLVFHKGRAPKGQRTAWKIHEYRAIGEELDGSKPGQGSFVLCKLFKKYDKNNEGSNCDDDKCNVYSPIIVTSFSEDIHSEQVTPSIGAAPENLPFCSGSYIAKNSGKPTFDVTLPVGSSNNCFGDVGADEVIFMPELEPEQMLRLQFSNAIHELPDGDDEVDTPFPSDVQTLLGSSCNLNYPISNDIGDVHMDQSGTNEQDDTFVDSILVTPDGYSCEDSGSQKNLAVENQVSNYVNHIERNSVKYTQSFNESDGQVALAQFDWSNRRKDPVPMAMCSRGYRTSIRNEEYLRNNLVEFLGNCYVAPGSNQSIDMLCTSEESTSYGTGIKLRTRQVHNQPSGKNCWPQGNAPRRIRLQRKFQVGSSCFSNKRVLSSKKQNHEMKPVEDKNEGAGKKYPARVGPAIVIDKFEHASFSNSNNVTEVAQQPGLDLKSGCRFPRGDDKEVPSICLKASPLHSISSTMRKLRVLAVLALFIVFGAYGFALGLKFIRDGTIFSLYK